MIKVTRIYTGPDGESHFGDIELPIDEAITGDEQQTKPLKAKEIWIRESQTDQTIGENLGWHPAPCRLMYLLLAGSLEIEVGDGTKRFFSAGDIFIAEDTTGRGHLSRSINRKAALVHLA